MFYKQRKIIFIAIAALILVAVVVSILIKVAPSMAPLGKATNMATQLVPQPTATPQGLQGASTFKAMQKINRDLLCRVTFKTDATMVQTVYLSQGLVRADMTVTAPGENTRLDTHLFLDGSLMYVWTSQATTGTSLDLEKIKPVEGTSKSAYQAQAEKLRDSLDKEVRYDCSPWIKDNEYFTTPRNIVFTDITRNTATQQYQFMTPDEASTAPQNTCSVCDSLPGNFKQKCATVMGC